MRFACGIVLFLIASFVSFAFGFDIFLNSFGYGSRMMFFGGMSLFWLWPGLVVSTLLIPCGLAIIRSENYGWFGPPNPFLHQYAVHLPVVVACAVIFWLMLWLIGFLFL